VGKRKKGSVVLPEKLSPSSVRRKEGSMIEAFCTLAERGGALNAAASKCGISLQRQQK